MKIAVVGTGGIGGLFGGLLAHAGPSDAPVAEQLAPHLARAAEAVDSGAGAALLERWVAATTAADKA